MTFCRFIIQESDGLRPNLPVAQHDPFLRSQPVQADRAADVDFVGGNADFRAEAVFEAVGEAGGGIDHDAGAVDRTQEGAGVGVGFGYDAVGVVAAVCVDVGDGFFETVDDFDGEDGGEVFGVPVFFGGRLNVGQDGQGTRAAAQLDVAGGVFLRQYGQDFGGAALVDEQGFHGVAGAVARGFGVEGDVDGLFGVGGAVDIDVADAVEVFDDGHAGFCGDAGNQRLAAARDDDVDKLWALQHGADAFAVGVFNQADGRCGQTVFN